MRYHLTPIHCRPWMLQGLSQKMIESHYENNYGGALRRLNAITEQLESLDFAKAPTYVVNGLKREELTALNSTLLHELYFASLAQSDGKPTPGIAEALGRDFGSVERWHMYEHAYHIDFGANVRAYVETFMRNLDWKSVEARYEDAKHVAPLPPLQQPEFGDLPAVSPEAVRGMLASGKRLQFIDVRPRFYVSRQQDIIEGAVWKDPENLQQWVGELEKDEPVVVFCAYGFHVGCRTTAALREAGFDATFMEGGHSAWKAMGGETKLYR